jgi:hypothetical protein
VTRVVRNPKTGMLETVDDTGPTQHDLERLRRETRARIDGTEQFHVDEYATPAPAAETPPCVCVPGLYLCTFCRGEEDDGYGGY